MDPVIRHPTPDEMPAFVTAMNTGFLEPADAEKTEKVAEELRQLWDLDRLWAAFDGDRLVGTFRSFATQLTVPGCAQVPGTALTAVSVMADHRRQGILRAMVAVEHEAARDRGEILGLLYSAEYPIYGRFGYGPATEEVTWTLDALAAEFHGEPTGSVELVSPSEATRDEMIRVFEAGRATSVGEIARPPYRWDYALALRRSAWGDDWKGFVAFHRGPAGEIDGYVRFHAEPEHWERRQPRNTIAVDDLQTLNPAARGDLWRFLASIDWVATVKVERGSLVEPLPWLLRNGRAASRTEGGDAVWVRLLDVRRALEARTYEREGRAVLEVVDGEAPGGRARFALDAGPSGATCAPTDRSPDLTVDISALGAAYLGWSRLRDAILPHGADEHRPGALEETTALFATLEVPWCSTFF